MQDTLMVYDLKFATPCWSATSSLLHLYPILGGGGRGGEQGRLVLPSLNTYANAYGIWANAGFAKGRAQLFGGLGKLHAAKRLAARVDIATRLLEGSWACPHKNFLK